ncbi:hypothetical protein B7486_39820 [cyanobacterium TDX16]|nr:hypothetical protein B7486_39820 [cyanobacterium TDX16]
MTKLQTLQTVPSWFVKSSILFRLLVCLPVNAQIVPDATLPNNSSVTTNGNTSTITEGTQAGSNLFHSFEQFSIPTGGTAHFNNAANIQNIFSRVTGGSLSNIDGLIKANGSANLFLFNPNGIVFGSNAKLDIGGSFLGTTANRIIFADGLQFSATAPPTTPLLTVSVPVGLGFGSNPGKILVQGNGQGTRTTTDLVDTSMGLRVKPNQTLALVGGDVALEGGTLKTAGGRIELASVAEPSLVSLTPVSSGWALGYESVPTFGQIHLSGQATVDASGAGGGDIQVQGRQVSLTDGSQIEASTLGAEQGGALAITATDLVELIGTVTNDGLFASGLFSQVYPKATGNSGTLTINTGRLSVRDGARITASTFDAGSAGNILINALESTEIFGTGRNGRSFSGIFGRVREEATGHGGNLTINTGRLSVRDGGEISVSTSGAGSAGNILINALESVEVVGTRGNGSFFSGIFGSVREEATGHGGNLAINTGRLSVRDGARISVSTFGAGSAGNMLVNALESVELIGTTANPQRFTGLNAQSRSNGNAGDLRIETGRLSVQDGARVSVSSESSGTAGQLQVQADSIQLDKRAKLTGETVSGEGGNIFLNSRYLQMREGSTISATAGLKGGGGNGGNITIDTKTLTALSGSSITANAFTGRGGNIEITTQGLFRSPDSIFSASSQFGIDGTVDVRTFGLEPDEALVPLNQIFIPTEQVVANSCLARRNKSQDRFVITGSGGLPESPNDSVMPMPLFSDRGLEQSLPQRSQSSAPTLWQEGDPVVEATGIVKTKDGRTLLGMAGSSIPDAQDAICQ